MNDSFVTLIPVTTRPLSLSINLIYNISLSNTGYKVITKILPRRLRPFLDEFTSPFQASFILVRRESSRQCGVAERSDIKVE